MFKSGKVIQFYSKTSIAIIELDGTLAVHDRIKFVRNGDTLFEQIVESIQVEYKKVDSANRDSIVALKTNEEIEKGDEIFKI